MKNKKLLFYLTLTIAMLTFAINIITYPHMPNRVPVHWGVTGEPDQYGTKGRQLAMGILPLLLFFVVSFMPRIDPKKENFKKHENAYSITIFVIILFISCLNLSGLFSSLGYNVPFQKVVPVALGLLLIVLGNYMTQFRHNYFVGFRTPWTLASEYVWKKTHRFGGYVFVLVGIVPLSALFIGKIGMYLFIGALAIGMIGTYVYSYLVFRKSS